MKRYAGKTALVTGAAGGIGAGIAARLAREGASVGVADIDLEGARTRVAQLEQEGWMAAAVYLDLTDAASVQDAVEATRERFGGIDVLVNNAAATSLMADDVPIGDGDPDLWDATFQANVRGTMIATKAAIPHLSRTSGNIVNIASAAGLTGDLIRPAYGASKAAIIAFTKHAATQYGRAGIRVNAVSPGYIQTPSNTDQHAETSRLLTPHVLTGRLGTPEDVAAAVAYLSSSDAGYLTGQVIAVDGGLLSHVPYYADLTSA